MRDGGVRVRGAGADTPDFIVAGSGGDGTEFCVWAARWSVGVLVSDGRCVGLDVCLKGGGGMRRGCVLCWGGAARWCGWTWGAQQWDGGGSVIRVGFVVSGVGGCGGE